MGIEEIRLSGNVLLTYRGQFYQCFLHAFFVQTSFLAAFASNILDLAPKFRTKNVGVNVDEIDTRCLT